uniref:Uncharacterized protein n=1 Tax=Arundo donax TaxID=35708 RepID=A0A0A8ZC90_ARUDO
MGRHWFRMTLSPSVFFSPSFPAARSLAIAAMGGGWSNLQCAPYLHVPDLM